MSKGFKFGVVALYQMALERMAHGSPQWHVFHNRYNLNTSCTCVCAKEHILAFTGF